MFKKDVYIERRNKLRNKLKGGLVLFLGNTESAFNYTDNAYHFNSGYSYDLTIRQSNGNLVWWNHNSDATSLPPNLSNRLYRTIYEMWENLRYSSNATNSIDTSITKVYLDDGGVFMDYTTAFNNTGTNDVPLIPAVEEVNDAFYFGSANKFSGLKLDIDTAGVGNTIVWEYWDGSAWSSLTVTDLTSGFTILTVHNHKVDDTTNTIISNNATNQTTVNTLLNEIKNDYNAHRVSTTFHDIADSTNDVSSADASDLGTSMTLANEIKSNYNDHRSQSGVHQHDDSENIVTAADAVDLATCITLTNEIKTNYNEHLVSTQDANTVTFTPQDNWVKSFINSSEQYWIRSRVSVAAFTTQPLLTQGWVIVADELIYSNTNLGMYSFEDTSANYCLICGITDNFFNTSSYENNKYFYNTSLLGKIIYSHSISYGGGKHVGYLHNKCWFELNSFTIDYLYNELSNGFIIKNIELIDTSIGSQNVYKLKLSSSSTFQRYATGCFASILITS